MVTMAVPLLVVASPASATVYACYSRGSYSFRLSTITTGSYYRNSDLTVWRNTSCSGSSILAGRTRFTCASRFVQLTALDYARDNIGIVLYTHGPSVGSEGAASPPVVGGGHLSSFSRPYDFWVRVGGTTNSAAHSLPIWC
jgi:hypothetical protein